MSSNQDIALKIRVVDAQGQFRGGTVDIEIKHRTLSDRTVQRGVDASREIAISGLRRAPTGGYQVTVTPTDVFKPQSQFVNIPASGFATMTVVIEKRQGAGPKPDPGGGSSIDSSFVVKGTVRTSAGTPFGGGTVRATHQSAAGTVPVPLGEARTTEQGSYLINYQSSLVQGPITLLAQVFDGGGKLLAQSDPVSQAKPEETIDLTVQLAGSVDGKVSHASGEPFVNGIVRVFDRDLRNEEQLGEDLTNQTGEYLVRYSPEQLRRSEKGSADLVVKAFDASGKTLAATPILFNAPAAAHIDLTIPAAVLPSLFETIGRALNPLLEGLKVEELEEDEQHQDLSFLSGETGLEKPVLARFVMAHKLAGQALRPEFWFALLGGSFFEYADGRSLRVQLTAVLDSLPSLDADTVRKSLTRALNEREISENFRDKIAAWTEEFLAFVARQSVSRTENPTFVKRALEDAGVKGAKEQETFARLFQEHKELTPALLSTLEKNPAFKKEAVADLRTSFQLADLTQGDFSVVKMLKDEFGIHQPEKIRTLAKKKEGEVTALVKAKHAAGQIKLPFEVQELIAPVKMPEAELYGKTLERRFREAFPTTAFVGGLERAAQQGGARGLRQAEALKGFLDRHESFELLSTPVDEFLKTSVHPDFKALAADENFRQEVKAVQRVFKLAPNFEATDTLLADDLHSAQKIYRMGESEFARRYAARPGFTAESAIEAWNRAADTNAAVVTIVSDLASFDGNGLPLALKNDNQALATFPNWNDLFKAGDLCECEHCRSVLGPAAYFADLLLFLRDRKAPEPANPNLTVKDVLFRRRPDLGYLELNCDNALVPLPYVDVVCEVLEDVVANKEGDLELSLAAIPADNTAKTAVANAFQNAFPQTANRRKQKIKPSDELTLSQVKPPDPNLWVVHSDAVTYLLKKKTPPNFSAEILRNTKASAEELRAYPQYVNPRAYLKLQEAKYPLALPFDLFAEEVRAAMQKTNLQRWDLMRTMRGTAAPNNPTDGDIAAEYFGISANAAAPIDEKRLILVADPTVAGQQEVWGEKSNPGWLAEVSNVKKFLRKTGLEYNELLTLLDLKFINPAGSITIHHQDDSCDTEKKDIQTLDENVTDRMHRFLRLWRKLKDWKMWMLDLVIRHPAIGGTSLDENFLLNLMYFAEVKKRLGTNVTIEQVAALFGNLNVATRFTKLHEKREDALYQNLFLNRRLINPLDPAFEIDPATGQLRPGQTLTAHQPVVLSPLGVREADLILLKRLTRASDNTPYINDDLTLANLSFLWRHAWLARLLRFKAEDWKIVLKLIAQPVPAFANLPAQRDFLEKNYYIKAAGLTQADVDALLLRVFHRDVSAFASPKSAFEFLEKIDQLKATGFTPDESNWLLAADRSAKAAMKEEDAARFLAALRKDLLAIGAENDPARHAFLTATPPTDAESLTVLLTSLLQKLNRDEAAAQFFVATLRNEIRQSKVVVSLPVGFTFPATITGAPNNIPIRYEPEITFKGAMTAAQRTLLLSAPSLSAVTGLPAYRDAIQKLFQQPGQATLAALPAGFTFPAAITGAPNNIPISYEPKLRFDGLMTAAQRTILLNDPTLSAVTGIAAYRAAIDEFFNRPRLALKFFEPVFTAPLASLPAAMDFKTLADPVLAQNISYDAEQRLLRFAGILSSDQKAALDALSADAPYRAAVNSLFTQPATGSFPAAKIWLEEADLSFPLRDLVAPANDNLAKNLAKAAKEALTYLSTTSSENAVVQQVSGQLGLTPAVTRLLLTRYALLPETLLAHLTGTFLTTPGTVDYATRKSTFDAWFWANRVAALWNKWRLTLTDLEKLIPLTAGAQLLDFVTLPLDSTRTIASIEKFLRTSRLFKMRESLPETAITLLEVLEKLNGVSYPSADFARDLERLNDAWLAANVQQLVASLNLAYPAAYRLAENWERLRRAFYFLDNLNASADTVKTFAAAAMSDDHTGPLKELLRSKFGAESWLSLSAEIQDALRERKRDALSAYLLAQTKPADAPSGKWENSNDLYAYYLLDVEMSACQLTSRLVQASGSVQLFVQRCFMGLEPSVKVKADGATGDSAWRWWKWMRKYRVWEANRKVFLWPENWIEPELRKEKSQFFKDFESELLQNEINQFTVETAFTNYLEKLDSVAQLEIAGFYQEDDGDNTILHVFGRTMGTEPHKYYYRRYDYRQWTPWEKVDLDIPGDYLIPMVVNKRLFLFWPVFAEVPHENNRTSRVPSVPTTGNPSFEHEPAKKILQMQMAVSEYRQGKWTPKKVSKEPAKSTPYTVDIVKKHYQFLPVDGSDANGRFGVQFSGASRGSNGLLVAGFSGAFEIAGCQGIPTLSFLPSRFRPTLRAEIASVGLDSEFMRWVELILRSDIPENDFTLENLSFPTLSTGWRFTKLLDWTPDIFKMSPPWHLSYMDKLSLDGQLLFGREKVMPAGTWLPFFYDDPHHVFFVLPALVGGDGNGLVLNYYPEIKKGFRKLEDFLQGLVQKIANDFNLSIWTPDQRKAIEQYLFQQFRDMPPPAYTDTELRGLLKRFGMRIVHYYLGALSSLAFLFRQFHFKNFYHPFACNFAELVYNPLKGLPALMSRETQLQSRAFSFKRSYQPTPWVIAPTTEDFYPKEDVDFSPDGAYSSYNWELFFHAPLLIANSLSKNQRFEEAREWYHFIFNPLGVESPMTGGSPMSKYWITKPFFETTEPDYVRQRIDNILRMLAGDTSLPGFTTQAKIDLEAQVLDWRTNPFEPHRIANYRTVAYQKTVVMKYLDNLIAWGDNLFRQDSMESINEATQLYVLAAEILGPRPKKVPPRVKPPVESFNELERQFDVFANALVQVENLVPPLTGNSTNGASQAPLPTLYFCIPQNDKMLGYWDTVADRLYKIRHCMNIEGVVRQLALFEPPIDPAALVKAVAGGLDISSALADLNAPLPLYRFQVLLQKANEVCNDVKALGGALLAALEKRDAEALGRLRQGQEIKLLEAVKAVRDLQIEEAEENLEGLRRSKQTIEERRNFYRDVEKLSRWETVSMVLHGAGIISEIAATVLNATAGVAHLIPKFTIGASGFGGSPQVTIQYGGENVGKSAFNWAAFFSGLGGVLHSGANLVSTQASNERRWDDWKFQERLAEKELAQVDKQIAAAELRVAIAEKERANHLIQIENARATDDFMRSKYTNEELYNWQVGQISGLYFQSYKLAYDLAKRAERGFRFELGLRDSSYINFGYWDSLKKGLLSGEKLQYDLRRLEAAYLEQNRREFELSKNISLALLNPLALVRLRETGRCFFSLPEEIFDLDYPGHYFRRIKSVSLTLPCVVGPYTTISCTLRLVKNSIRINTANGDNGYAHNTDSQGLPSDDGRFVENTVAVKSIAASHAQNDSGVFELSFRDDRYLPFEGVGAISDWSLELFTDLPANNPDPARPDFGRPLRQFDYGSISDAIVHIKYTAREDAGPFKNGAVAHLRDYFSQAETMHSLQLFSLRQEFPSQWHRFLNPTNPANGNILELEMSPSLFPIRDAGKTLKVNTIWLLARCTPTPPVNYDVVLTLPPPMLPPTGATTMTLAPRSEYGGLHFNEKDVSAQGVQIAPAGTPVKWTLRMTRPGGGNLQEDPVRKVMEVEDLLLVLGYEWE